MPLHAQARELLDVLAEIGEASPPADAAELRDAIGLDDAERELLRRRGLEIPPPETIGGVEDRRVAGDVHVRILRPRPGGDDDRALPVLVYVHGGGWVIGDVESDDVVPRALANRARCVVVSVDYRLAPEHPFPASHDDVLAVTRWVMDHGDELDADPARVVIAGESAGATMAVATCAALAQEGHRLPVAQLLVYPVTDLVGEDYPSYHDADGIAPLTVGLLRWFGEQETTDTAELADPRLSPLLAAPDQLAAQPPTLVLTAEGDPLRDQGERYARALMDAGVHVTLSRFPGVMHGFLGRVASLDGARQALLQATALVRAGFDGYEPAAQ